MKSAMATLAALALFPLFTLAATAAASGEAKSADAASASAAESQYPERESVQLWANGPGWATCNIGAEKPEDCGFYFFWGDTVGYKRVGGTLTGGESYSRVTWVSSVGARMVESPFNPSNCPSCKPDADLTNQGWMRKLALAPERDAARAHWGDKWRMPTMADLSNLCRNCDWTWATENGVEGYRVSGRGAYAGKSIFIPAAGVAAESSLYKAGRNGYLWSATSIPGASEYSWEVRFRSGSYTMESGSRHLGQSVRAVSKPAK